MGAAREDDRSQLNAQPDAERAGLRKRSVVIGGHATSVTLEEVFWRGLKRIADARGISTNVLLTEIDQTNDGNLSSAIRVFVFERLTGERGLDTK